RCVRPEVGTEIVAKFRTYELVHVLSKLVARHTPGEVCIRLRKSDACERCHYLRTWKCFRQEDDVFVTAIYFRVTPVPQAYRLGVRVIDAKNLHPLFDPIEENRAKFLPQRFPIVRFKIERIDVLVFLRRILSILYGAIGTFTKPLR